MSDRIVELVKILRKTKCEIDHKTGNPKNKEAARVVFVGLISLVAIMLVCNPDHPWNYTWIKTDKAEHAETFHEETHEVVEWDTDGEDVCYKEHVTMINENSV